MGKIAGSIVSYGCVVLAFFWLGLLCAPFGWHTRQANFGDWSVGLYIIKAHWVKPIEKGFEKAYDIVGVKYDDNEISSLNGYKEKMCLMSNNWQLIGSGMEAGFQAAGMAASLLGGRIVPDFHAVCDHFQYLLIASLVMLFCGVLCVLCLLAGALCVHHYYQQAAREKTRLMAQAFLAVAGILPLISILVYTFVTRNTFEWLGNLMGSSETSSFYICYWLAWPMVIFTWAPLIILELYGKADLYEEYNETVHHEKKEQMRDQINQMSAGVHGGFGDGGFGGQQQQWQPASEPQGYGATSGWAPSSNAAGFGPPPQGPQWA